MHIFWKSFFVKSFCPENYIHLGLLKLQTSVSSTQQDHCVPLGLPCLHYILKIPSRQKAREWQSLFYMFSFRQGSWSFAACCQMSEDSYFMSSSYFPSASLESFTLTWLERERERGRETQRGRETFTLKTVCQWKYT